MNSKLQLPVLPEHRASPPPAAQGQGGRIVLLALMVIATLVLSVRLSLPFVAERFRPDLVAMLEHATGLPVRIEHFSLEWVGLRPRLRLSEVTVTDHQGEAVFRLDSVEGTLAWSSLWQARLVFHRLVVSAPELVVSRASTNQVFVAGMQIGPAQDEDPEGGFSGWLLLQHEVILRGAGVKWLDQARMAPPLELQGLEIRVLSQGGRHRLAMVAEPPRELGGRLEIRADLTRSPLDANWRTLEGRVFAAIDDAVPAAWRTWLDYPLPVDGFGSLRVWLDIEAGRLIGMSVRFALADTRIRLGGDLPELKLTQADGRIDVSHTVQGSSLAVRGLGLQAAGFEAVKDVDLDFEIRSLPEHAGGRLTLNRIDVTTLTALARHLPLDPLVRQRLVSLQPRGRAEGLKFEWTGGIGDPESWSVDVRFFNAGIRSGQGSPGFEGFSGEFSGDSETGRFRLDAQKAIIDLPSVFAQSRLGFTLLQAQGTWRQAEKGMEVVVDQARFENADAEGRFSGRYVLLPDGPGWIDFSGQLDRADVEAVWRYLPLELNQATRDWLRESLTTGVVSKTDFRLKGDLHDFPFPNGKLGEFAVMTRFGDVNLDYADGWPAITGAAGELRFEGSEMSIKLDRAQVFGVALTGVTAHVADLGAIDQQLISLKGTAEGPSADFLRFVAESPINERIDGKSTLVRATGSGALDLRLEIPLHEPEASRVEGRFNFSGNQLSLQEGFPVVSNAAGHLTFSERAFAINRLTGRLLGEPLSLNAKTSSGGGFRLAAEGGARISELSEAFSSPLFDYLSGAFKWQLDLNVTEGIDEWVVRSELKGMSSNLPAPYSKAADEVWPLVVRFAPPSGRSGETLGVNIQDRLDVEMQWARSPQGRRFLRGGVGLFQPARAIEGGIHVGARLEQFDFDTWQAILESASSASAAASAGGMAGMPVKVIDARVDALQAFGRRYDDVEIHALAAGGGWDGRIASDQVNGTFAWRRPAGHGALRARLTDLHFSDSSEEIGLTANAKDRARNDGAEAEAPAPDSPLPSQLPALDIVADRFVLRGMDLGRLSLQAVNRDGVWDLASLELINPEGRFNGSGHWIAGGAMLTEMKFDLAVTDIGGFLGRLRYPDAIGLGSAELSGELAWRGAPTRIDPPSLSGALKVEARSGQFSRLDPGVGRLLGVLSLQALPRRLTLDFRDVFSEGFAFDRISGSIALEEGVMRSDDLEITGPAAQIQIKGTADIGKETQALEVTVQPTLSESFAIGAAAGLINPVVGVVTYLAQKALSDPIEKMFAFRYSITGSWADPQVESLGGLPEPLQTQRDSVQETE